MSFPATFGLNEALLLRRAMPLLNDVDTANLKPRINVMTPVYNMRNTLKRGFLTSNPSAFTVGFFRPPVLRSSPAKLRSTCTQTTKKNLKAKMDAEGTGLRNINRHRSYTLAFLEGMADMIGP